MTTPDRLAEIEGRCEPMTSKQAKEILRPFFTTRSGPGITDADLVSLATEMDRLHRRVRQLRRDLQEAVTVRKVYEG